MVTLVKSYGAEVWIYRGRVAAVLSALNTLERSRRRTCHQEYRRIVIIAILFQFFMLFGLLSYTILHTVHRLCDKRNRRMLSWREPPTYSTIPHVSSRHVVLYQTNAYSSGSRSVGADEIKNPLNGTGGLHRCSSDHPSILQYRLHQLFTSPPLPHPEISIPIDRRSEGLLMATECRRARKGRTERSQGVFHCATSRNHDYGLMLM